MINLDGKKIQEIYTTKIESVKQIDGLPYAHYFDIILIIEDNLYQLLSDKIIQWNDSENLCKFIPEDWGYSKDLNYKDIPIKEVKAYDTEDIYILLENNIIIENNIEWGNQILFLNYPDFSALLHSKKLTINIQPQYKPFKKLKKFILPLMYIVLLFIALTLPFCRITFREYKNITFSGYQTLFNAFHRNHSQTSRYFILLLLLPYTHFFLRKKILLLLNPVFMCAVMLLVIKMKIEPRRFFPGDGTKLLYGFYVTTAIICLATVTFTLTNFIKYKKQQKSII